jgi:preprotein translocase subunit SecE
MLEKFKSYTLSSIDEIKNKISWTPYNELQNSTIIVLVASLIFALAVGLVDFVFENGMTWFYRSF